MKKICFVSTTSTTLSTFVMDIAIYLHKNANYEVSFICNYDENFEVSLPSFISYYPVKMRRGLNLDGLRVILEMKKIFKDVRFDIVQYSTPNASLYASTASRLAKVKVRLYCQWGIYYVGLKAFKRKIFKILEKITCRNSTWIEPDSFGNLRFSHLEGLYKDSKSSVVWNGSAAGVNLNKFDHSKKDEWKTEIRQKHNISTADVVYTFIGRITRDKGINELFQAFKEIVSNKEDVYLLMVGVIENGDLLNKELYNWSINHPHIIWTGYSNEVQKYLAASDVYILPSYREGFGSGVIEAQAMGVASIVTNIPGPSEAILENETGFIVTKGDPKMLFYAMEKLYTSKELRYQFGYSGIEYVKKNFDRNILFEKILEDRDRLINSF